MYKQISPVGFSVRLSIPPDARGAAILYLSLGQFLHTLLNMRIPRSLQLIPPTASVHMYQRCHNKEYYLRPPRFKALYMQAAAEGLKHEVTSGKVKITSFCILDNHLHAGIDYEDSFEYLSRFMRHTNSLFGARYNRLNDRSGKVSESRPKTTLIENVEHEMRAHFYIEANDVRAGISTPENLRLQKYNSFKFYAYGMRDEYTSMLTTPEWYIELGSNPKERQSRYRELFYAYLKEDMPKQTTPMHKQNFLGSLLWTLQQEKRIKFYFENLKKDSG